MKLFKKHLRWFLERVDRDRLDSTAAHGAFFLLISFLPFVAFLLTLLQQIHFADGVTLIEAALGIFPTAWPTTWRACCPALCTPAGCCLWR